MAFTKKVWEDRQSEYPNRRKLKPTGIADTFDVARDEGLVVKEGNPFNAASMNDLETRVEGHTSDLSLHVTTLTHTKTATAHNLVGTLPTSGIISANFQATTDFLANDTFSVNSAVYTAKPNGEETTLPDKAFIVGDLVNVTIDIGGKKLGFKLGGSVNDTLPSQITRLAGEAQNGAVRLTWINPTTDFTGLYITRKAGSMPTKLSDGTKLDCGSATSYLDSGLINGTSYYYRSFPYNSKKQIQTEIADSVINVAPSSNISISELPVGTLIVDANTKYYNVPIVWKIADKNHSGYPANSVTLIAEQILTLKCFDAKEPSNSDADRKGYGNNRYIHANIRSWLNSQAGAGTWYTAQHSADTPPNSTNINGGKPPYDTQAGFLNAFSSNFLNALLTATLTVAKNTVTDGGGYETFSDKLFLASSTEVGLANENSIAEGAKLTLFSDNTSRIATLTAEAASNDGSGSAGAAWYWWLRTPRVSSAFYPHGVESGGTLNYNYAFSGYNGVRPLCNLSSSIRVKPQPNAQGQYEIAF